jgi:hypothetical protein
MVDTPRVEDLWEKQAYGESGQRLGRIEAVGMGRDRVPRRVGVRSDDGGPALTFYALAGATIAGDRVVIATDRSLRVLSRGSA